MCITAAVVANAPGIAAAVGGFAAAKVALGQKHGPVMPDRRPLADDKPAAVVRPVVARRELPRPLTSTMSYEEEW